ncbi:hypothetical protein KNN17_13960 [Arthrobacter bambusae]|jgi:hypothetical protein|uniref:hypothetical protein n=1 Tax=Arthrobacter TaxID=1663 RepID=UPI001F513C97|nr:MULTISPECIES: hypothetical protein [Arthrobacter]MCI0142680.1 hypothetical protein [Arthrobacter bambusae]UYY81918.1 hypothetical protein OIT41_02250 [Arthrobacter sp. YA7-1]
MSRKTKKPKTRGGHLKAVPSAPRMPLQLVLNHRVVDSFTPDFVRWYERFSDAEDALQCLHIVKLFISASHAISEESSATWFDPDSLDDAALALASTLDEADSDEALVAIFDYLHLYTEFLFETGRWSGTEEDYFVLHMLLTEEASGELGLPDDIPELSDEEQDRAFQELPVLQLTGRLLEWLGAGKDVTSTGVLRLKDIEGAAGAVGVKARGKKTGKRPLPEGEGAAEADPESFEVGSMHEVPVLREIWAALVDIDGLSIGSTRAAPGAAAESWDSPDLDSRLQIRREFLTVFLASAVMDSGDMWEEGPRDNATLARVLLRGATGEPVSVDELKSAAANESVGSALPTFEAIRALRELATLADLGLVDVDTHYTVPPPVIQCVIPALALVLAMEDNFEPGPVHPG